MRKTVLKSTGFSLEVIPASARKEDVGACGKGMGRIPSHVAFIRAHRAPLKEWPNYQRSDETVGKV